MSLNLALTETQRLHTKKKQALAEADSVDSVALLVATGQEDRAARLLSSWVDLSGALAIGQVKHARER
jgi:hypothetical protein